MKKNKKIAVFSFVTVFAILSLVFFVNKTDAFNKFFLYDIPKSNTTSEARYYEYYDSNNQNITVYYPDDSIKNNQWVLFSHGNNGSNKDMLNLKNENSLMENLISDGYTVVVPEFRDIKNWGNPQSVEDISSAYDYANENLGLEGSPILILQSMGALSGLNALQNNLISASKIIGIYPVTNLEYEFFNSTSEIADLIKKSYDVSEFKYIEDPFDPSKIIDISDSFSVPILLIYSNEDTIVPAKGNSLLFYEKIKIINPDVTLYEHVGNHGDESAFDYQIIKKFLQ